MSTASSLHYRNLSPQYAQRARNGARHGTAPHREILALQQDLVSPNLFFLQDIELIELGSAP
jgi:hypothetical protein